MKKVSKQVVHTVQTTKGHGNKNLQEILDYHIFSKRFIGGLCRLEKNGTLSKVNGQVFARKTTKSGEGLVIVDNLFGKKRAGQNKRWQAILTKNLICVRENKWEHKKIDK